MPKTHVRWKMDRRVIRTKKAIRSALLQLTLEKDVEKITIKEIAKKADVDRKTVYNYYNGISEIFGEIENELIASFHREAEALVNTCDVQQYFLAIARLINQDFEMYELIMRSNNSTFITKTVLFLREWIQTTLNQSGKLNPEKIAAATEYLSGGIFNAYRYWFQSDRKKPLEQFSLELCSLVMEGLPAYFLRG